MLIKCHLKVSLAPMIGGQHSDILGVGYIGSPAVARK